MTPEEFAEGAQQQQVTRTGAPVMCKKEPDMPLWVILFIFLSLCVIAYLKWRTL